MPEDGEYVPRVAHHAATKYHGQRFVDDKLREHWHDPVGVGDLLEAGASWEDPLDVRLAEHVKIHPSRTDEWVAKITRSHLRAIERDGVVRSLGVEQAVETRTFDDRDGAAEWAGDMVPDFANASVRETVSDTEDGADE